MYAFKDAEEFFNDLLASSCSNQSEQEGFNEYYFTIEAHCHKVEIKVVAKCINRDKAMWSDEPFRYQIKSIEKV